MTWPRPDPLAAGLVNIAALITPVAVAGSASLGWPGEAAMLKRTIDWTATRVEADQDVDDQTALRIGVWFGFVVPIGLALIAIWSLLVVGQGN